MINLDERRPAEAEDIVHKDCHFPGMVQRTRVSPFVERPCH